MTDISNVDEAVAFENAAAADQPVVVAADVEAVTNEGEVKAEETAEAGATDGVTEA